MKNKTKRDKPWAIKHLNWILWHCKNPTSFYWKNQGEYAVSVLNRK